MSRAGDQRDRPPEGGGVEADGHRVDARWFRSRLLGWGEGHVRSFPWRETDDPYRLLMAEVMLHRTQVSQVLPVYERFVVLFPDIEAVARASRESIHGVMGSLGLHWRIDLVGEMAREIVERFGGRVPSDRDALLSLPRRQRLHRQRRPVLLVRARRRARGHEHGPGRGPGVRPARQALVSAQPPVP